MVDSMRPGAGISPVSRRTLLKAAGVAAAGTALAGAGRFTARATPGSGATRVAVLGGGVAGLTAAHELAERGFSVTVYERKAFGGKAKSMYVPGTGSGGRRDLPGEHGHRGYFGFYRHLPDTLGRIPFPGNANGVLGNLETLADVSLARAGRLPDWVLTDPIHTPDLITIDSIRQMLLGTLVHAVFIPPWEAAYVVDRILVYLTSCDERRYGQWEYLSWWDYLGASARTIDYQRVFGGSAQIIQALKAQTASARTAGQGIESILFSGYLQLPGSSGPLNRVMNAPTNEAWIDPWIRYLESLGVEFRLPAEVVGLDLDGDRIGGARVRGPGGTESVDADWFVLAVPLERATPLLTTSELAARDPQFENLKKLQTSWSNGIQYYLNREPAVLRGHVAHIDSPWKLVSLPQGQIWRENFSQTWGSGREKDCLSVVISDWVEEPGVLHGKPASRCTPQQIAEDAWEQMKRHVNDSGTQVLTDDMIESYFIDPAAQGLGTDEPYNDERYFLNTVGSWNLRPTAHTAVPNLFLAADYVQTPKNIDFTSMEAANEAGRHAVNALLDTAGSREPHAALFDGYRPPELEPLKAVDRARYLAGQPNILDIG
ncbi:FAD-dependent oxidoreductase [Nocardia sp. NPDC050710]|uniref:hydroxysqualene dehydroxylase n=1 Tax=Nocardia sp. NPDC050710 TaxID=3157220 RepID=UPI0033D78553